MNNKTKMLYFKNSDVLHLAINNDAEAESIEISPNITAELNEKGELIGIEILNASDYMCNSIMETVQAKILNIKKAA